MKQLSNGYLFRNDRKAGPFEPDLVGEIRITRDDFKQLAALFAVNEADNIECFIAVNKRSTESSAAVILVPPDIDQYCYWLATGLSH